MSGTLASSAEESLDADLIALLAPQAAAAKKDDEADENLDEGDLDEDDELDDEDEDGEVESADDEFGDED